MRTVWEAEVIRIFRNGAQTQFLTKIAFNSLDKAHNWLDRENAELFNKGMPYRLGFHVVIPIDLLEGMDEASKPISASMTFVYPNGCNF